ncbi:MULTISPECIES: hypothetical protein [Streptomyces]|uniref:Uncharacterized protein n=1 Tax=Streptomyces venezuelae (strain ATCC 10712 / CBS 650.69 / DSM 40230 / JCM 4526 / NBRC 13096 / PD 04745) TaxID=953739 RepID=F2RGE7_STRVP|nr:hypothetical protein [Streptomyces venezuelae]APE25282.1 hypothetical protein vnz_32465 [Streptomyces venezuelae]QES02622.1 hypothetical protein DEJ43_32995 [Streptomyces venezuelae ATCC 10712]QES09608.1 hypothetical protein DEJ44_30915 [Streptomyces venezuelae]CCA59867.1 hypothetical protein SVEN_6581 [Streptomyces venezuelae ATCC 10712]
MGQTDANGVDLSGVTGRLVQTVDLVKSPAPQAIATDTVNGHIFVLQVESSATAPQGNLYLNRIDRLTGTVTGSMQLKGFGHGLSMGAEPVGTDTYLWTEVGPLHTTSDGTTFGKAVTRFLFEPGKVLDGSLIPSERKFTPPGSTSGTGPSLDPVNRQLCVMYHKDGKRHFTRYDAAAAATGSWVPVGSTFVMPAGEDVTPDVPSPYPLKKTLVSQGFTVLGDVLYAYQWAPYDQENNPTTVPDAFPGIAFLTSYSWTTGQRLDRQVVTGADGLTRREPEGVATEVDPATGETRLLFGFSNTVPGTTGSRDVTICWYPTKPAVDGIKVLADWEDLALEPGISPGASRPRGRLIALAGTTYLQLRGTVTCSPGLTADGRFATLPHRLRATRLTRQNVPRNNNTGRCVCRIETDVSGGLRVYGPTPDNAITWIDLDGVSVAWR